MLGCDVFVFSFCFSGVFFDQLWEPLWPCWRIPPAAACLSASHLNSVFAVLWWAMAASSGAPSKGGPLTATILSSGEKFFSFHCHSCFVWLYDCSLTSSKGKVSRFNVLLTATSEYQDNHYIIANRLIKGNVFQGQWGGDQEIWGGCRHKDLLLCVHHQYHEELPHCIQTSRLHQDPTGLCKHTVVREATAGLNCCVESGQHF